MGDTRSTYRDNAEEEALGVVDGSLEGRYLSFFSFSF
jgi:hypothetical protein